MTLDLKFACVLVSDCTCICVIKERARSGGGGGGGEGRGGRDLRTGCDLPVNSLASQSDEETH